MTTTCDLAEAKKAKYGENDDDCANEPNNAVHYKILFRCERVTFHNALRTREFH